MSEIVAGPIRTAAGLLLVLLLGGCGGDSGGGGSSGSGKELSGVYVPQGEALYQRFEFQPGHKVAVTFFTAQPRVVDYAVMPDGRVQILGQKVLTLRDPGDGCLVTRGPDNNGVEIDVPEFGRYCRQ
jgi:hypothetical protein